MTLSKFVPSVASGLFVVLAACGGSSPAPAPQAPRAVASAADPSCPVTVPGTSVTVEDASTGAALVFVTTSDVAELRTRVAAMAQMHNEHHGAMGPLPDGAPAEGADHSAHAGHGAHANHGAHAGHDMGGAGGGEHAGHAGGMIGVHSKAAVSDIEGGARLELISGAADVGKLQGELRMHAQHLASGTCEMGAH